MRYYKGSSDVVERLQELKAIANPEQTEEITKKLEQLDSWKEQGYEPMLLCRLGSRIRFCGAAKGIEKFCVHKERVYAYNTTRYGDAYENVAWVVCKPVGVKDCNGCGVYEAPDGQKFVLHEWPGSPEAFGGTEIWPPALSQKD